MLCDADYRPVDRLLVNSVCVQNIAMSSFIFSKGYFWYQVSVMPTQRRWLVTAVGVQWTALLVNRTKIVSTSYHTQWICNGIVGGRQRSSCLHGRSCRSSKLYSERCQIDNGCLASDSPLPAPIYRRRAGTGGRRRRVSAGQVLVSVRPHSGRQ